MLVPALAADTVNAHMYRMSTWDFYVQGTLRFFIRVNNSPVTSIQVHMNK